MIPSFVVHPPYAHATSLRVVPNRFSFLHLATVAIGYTPDYPPPLTKATQSPRTYAHLPSLSFLLISKPYNAFPVSWSRFLVHNTPFHALPCTLLQSTGWLYGWFFPHKRGMIFFLKGGRQRRKAGSYEEHYLWNGYVPWLNPKESNQLLFSIDDYRDLAIAL